MHEAFLKFVRGSLRGADKVPSQELQSYLWSGLLIIRFRATMPLVGA
jgi:hypothetical protein